MVESKARDCSLMLCFYFAAKLIEQFAILFFTSLAEKNLYYQGVVRFLPWEIFFVFIIF